MQLLISPHNKGATIEESGNAYFSHFLTNLK